MASSTKHQHVAESETRVSSDELSIICSMVTDLEVDEQKTAKKEEGMIHLLAFIEGFGVPIVDQEILDVMDLPEMKDAVVRNRPRRREGGKGSVGPVRSGRVGKRKMGK